jgi:predicted lactoylglutathione lyase
MKGPLPPGIPEIPVKDIERALDYYRDKLGFSIDWFEKSIGLAGISRGDCRMFVSGESFRSFYKNVGPIMTWINMDSVEEVDAIYAEWNASGAALRVRPELKPHGLYEFAMEDRDGNFFRVFHDDQTGGAAA